MKTMKTLLAIALVVPLGFVVPLATTGCKTVTKADGTTVSKPDPARTCEAIRALLPAGVMLAVQKDTNSIPYLQSAVILIKAATESGNYDVAYLEDALSKISVKELRTPEAKVAIEAALGIYKAYFGETVRAKLDTTVWAKPVLVAIGDSIAAGLTKL